MENQEIQDTSVRVETTKNEDGSIIKTFPANYFSKNKPSTTVKCGMLSQAEIKGSFVEERDDLSNPRFIRKEYTPKMLMNDFLKEHKKIVMKRVDIERKEAWRTKIKSLINPYSYLKPMLCKGYQMVESLGIRLKNIVNYLLSRVIVKKK